MPGCGSKESLGSFVDRQPHPILRYSVEGSTGGVEYVAIGGHGTHFAGEWAWRHLCGTVDRMGVWRWDGEPSDEVGTITAPTPRHPQSRAWDRWQGGDVATLIAYEDPAMCRRVAQDWPSSY